MVENINWDEFRVRCSAISKVQANSRDNMPITDLQKKELADLEKKDTLTNKQKERIAELQLKAQNSTKITLGDTCVDYLMESYAWVTERMISVNKESMDLLAMRKGKLGEEDGIKLLSLVHGEVYFKNDQQVFNDFLTGEPDIYLGDDIYNALLIDDTKNSFDYPTHLRSINKPVETAYRQQVAGYGDICNCTNLRVSRVLVDAPAEIIEEMKYKVAKKFGAMTVESPEFLKEWEKWERSLVYSSTIPMHKRVYSQKVEPFTEAERIKLYDRVKVCREWLFAFHEKMLNLNLT